MNTTGLAPHTGKIFEGISRLECIKPFVVGWRYSTFDTVEHPQASDAILCKSSDTYD